MFLPQKIYKYHNFLKDLEMEGENQPIFIQESVSFDKEPLIKIQGTDMPYRLLVGDEELEAINLFKASLIVIMSALNPFSLFQNKNKLIDKINRLGYRTIKPLILKQEHWTTFHKEFYVLIFAVLLKFKIDEDKARPLAEYISYTIEYDTAYKTRLQDMFNETSPDRFDKPVRELRRLFRLFVARNKDRHVVKYKKFVDLLTLAFLFPNISRKFQSIFHLIDWKSLCPDEIDEYWMSMKVEYDYFGKTLEERLDEGFAKWKYVHTKEEYLNCQL